MRTKTTAFAFFGGMFVLAIIIVSLSSVSADWFSWITGRATQQNVVVNVTVSSAGSPQITAMFPWTSAGTTVTPKELSVNLTMINFSVTDPNGYTYLQDTSAKLNASRGGEATRTNTSCIRYQQGGNNANYSCTLDLWYFDSAGVWNLTAWISDVNNVNVTNSSANLSVQSLTAFVSGPATLSFGSITPGATNTTAAAPLILNDTGNYNVTGANLLINATNLRGETTSSQAIWAGNMSVGNQTGGSPANECGKPNSTIMSSNVYTALGTALGRGNLSTNDGATGQRRLYTCIILAGSELSSQSYSTSNESSWTVKIQ